MTPAVALWVSDYVDTVLAVAAAREREAFARGREAGRAEGRAEAQAAELAAWRVLLDRYRDVIRAPSYAQLDRRRYGPGGRESWVIRRPDAAGEAERLDSARLHQGAGRWPKDIRRRAARRGDPDPFHMPRGANKECTACAWWGLPCPGNNNEEDSSDGQES